MRLTHHVCAVITAFWLFACGGSSSTPDTTPPGYPTGFSLAMNGEAVEITWTLPTDSDLAGVLVLRRADLEPETLPETGRSYAVGDLIGEALVVFRGQGTSQAYIDTPPSEGRWCYQAYVFDTSYNYTGSATRCVDTSGEDTTPPTFDGLVSATGVSNTQITLEWEAATDDVTPAAGIVYEVYQSATETGFDFSTPSYQSGAGHNAFTVFGLAPGTTYWFVVRARDEAGNRDTNLVARSATTLSGDDTTPPIFSGLVVATPVSSSRIDLFWGAASDETTPAAEILYDIYRASVSGGQSYGAPTYTTAPGATSFPVSGLNPATTYYFVVRARDAAGNQDANTEERSATTLEQSDVTPPTFAGLTSATAVGDTQIQLSWSAASDNETAAADMVYLVYQASTSGGQSFATPTMTTNPGETTVTVGSLTPSTAYYFVVRARDEAGNSDTNAVERSATTLSGPDSTPPNFTGILSATAVSSTAIDLAWNAAVDNVTPQGGIVYDIYYATTSGTQSFAVPQVSTPPGALTHRVTGLSPSTTYFFVVRARDAAGNRDANLMERHATTEVVDTTPPVIQSDNFNTGGALVTGTTAFVASVTFSEEVTGMNATHVTINNGASLGSFATSDGLTFNFTATGLVDGTRYTVSFSSGIRDLSLNPLSPTTREIYVAANVLYVRPGGAGNNSGTSPANALPLVSQALVLAAPGTDIYVQGGSYTDSITLKEGVNIYGGYDPSFTVRDPVNNESLLSQSAFDTTVTATGTGLTRNTVIDGMAFTNTRTSTRYVLRVLNGAGVTIRGSRLFLPEAGCHEQAVVDSTSGTGNSLVVERSIISAGGLSFAYCNGSTHGVTFESADSYLRLDGNTIVVGGNANTSTSYNYYHYALRLAGETIEVVNNVIDGGGAGGGTSGRSYGVLVTTSAAYLKMAISNNTISGGGANWRYAVYISGTISGTYDIRLGNNVLFTSAAASSAYAIYRTSNTGSLRNVENNMITSVGVFIRSTTEYTTLSSMETFLTGVGTVATFNKEVASHADLHFEDYANRDWRPSSLSPVGLTAGGRDTSADAWGSVTTDRAGNPRTLLFSIGAYEKD